MASSSSVSMLLLLVSLVVAIAVADPLEASGEALQESDASIHVKVKCNVDVAACLRGKRQCCQQLEKADAACFCSVARKVAVTVSVDVAVNLLKTVCPKLVDVHVHVVCPGGH